MFIVLEGIDHCGKTVQSKKLSQFWQSILIQFPNRQTEIGKKIDKYLRKEVTYDNQTIKELFSKNRHEFSELIIKTLNDHKMVICDRYSFSGCAYALARENDEEVSQETINQYLEIDDDLPKPNFVFLLDIDPMQVLSRYDNENLLEIHENIEFQTKVRHIFLQMAEQFKWVVIDASMSIEDIFLKINEFLNHG